MSKTESEFPPDIPEGQRATAGFLRDVFAGQENGHVALFSKPSNRSRFLAFANQSWFDKAAEAAMHEREDQNVYFAIGVQGAIPAKGRGKEAGVIALPGVWADIDVLGPNHAAKKLPPSLEDAWGLVRAVPFTPTVVVYTGGGMQAYWLFREPWQIDTEPERSTAKKLSKAFQAYLQRVAGQYGWTVDSTTDLSRLLRLPGTWNRKGEVPAPVYYETVETGQRYNPSEFKDFLDVEADPELKAHLVGVAPDQPRADFRKVLAGCPWVRHCKNDAATLPEPEWYRMLSIVGRCRDGQQLAHDLSRPYPCYTAAETDAKLQQAMGAAGPATCAYIGDDLAQSSYCERCRHQGKIKSPIVLGIPKRLKTGEPEESSTPVLLCTAEGRLPDIQVSDRQLRDVSHECVEALRARNTPPALFVRAGRLVRVATEETGRPVIQEVNNDILRNRLTRSADFYQVKGDLTLNCAPPIDVVKDILSLPPDDWGFPAIQGVIEAPALREDGTLITESGYDQQSHLLYVPADSLDLPVLPDTPNQHDITAAVAVIDDVIGDLPFVDQASKANAIASLLTPVCRPAIKGRTPLALYDATTQGTGKTLLAEVVSLIVSGREGALFSAPRDEEEFRKQLTAVLREGTAVVVIDNVIYKLDSGALCKALTETTHGDRILGLSEAINLPVRCTWIATGNNIQLGGDMPRRCYWIRMDAKVPKPFQRKNFKHKRLKQYVLAHRGELLVALLTLARAWFMAGSPEPKVTPVGGFEDWTITVGGILQNAGINGFLENADQLYEQADNDSSQWESLLDRLAAVFGNQAFTVSQVWERMHQGSPNFTSSAQQVRSALPDFVADVMDREGYFKQRLSRAFRERLGRRFGDSEVHIERDADDRHAKVKRWRVVYN
jgi:hypothetical protein